IATGVDAGAREILARKAAMRVVAASPDSKTLQAVELRSIVGAILAQERDVVVEARAPWSSDSMPDGFRVASRRPPSAEEWEALRFAWRVCAHVKSNSVVFTNREQTLSVGAGQMSRVAAVNVAIMTTRGAAHALAGSV